MSVVLLCSFASPPLSLLPSLLPSLFLSPPSHSVSLSFFLSPPHLSLFPAILLFNISTITVFCPPLAQNKVKFLTPWGKKRMCSSFKLLKSCWIYKLICRRWAYFWQYSSSHEHSGLGHLNSLFTIEISQIYKLKIVMQTQEQPLPPLLFGKHTSFKPV